MTKFEKLLDHVCARCARPVPQFRLAPRPANTRGSFYTGCIREAAILSKEWMEADSPEDAEYS